MPIYRLEPIDDFEREQSWRHSVLKTTCWVKAPDEDEARRMAAIATLISSVDHAFLPESPWLSPVLTMCIEEAPDFAMEPEIAISVDGISQAWARPPGS